MTEAASAESALRVLGAPRPVEPVSLQPSEAILPRPLELENYRFAAAIRSPVAQLPPSTASDEPSLREIAPREIPLVRGHGPAAPAPRPLQVATLPSITPIEEPDILPLAEDSENNEPLAVPNPHPKTIAFAPRTAPSRAAVSRPTQAPPSDLVVAIPDAASEPQPAPGTYVHDGAAELSLCNEQHHLPGSCPYYPWQSGTQSICGVDCGPYGAACCETWKHAHLIPWSVLGPGEYVGPPRPEHVPAYYLRVNDVLTLTYIVSRQEQADRYHIGVGDRLRIESSVDRSLDRELLVQPDGHINLPLIGDVPAAGKTIQELREDVVDRYSRIERDPLITITPLQFNTGLQEILNAVTSQSRLSGQAIDLRVTPEGTIQAPGLGSIYVQGLAIEELRSELEARYAAIFGPGLLISPSLTERATSYVFIGGEVATPGRYTLEGPTTVMQAIALAGGWNNGGNTREVVVFRRDENWCLKATKIDVHGPLYGKDPCPVNDVWLRDNDLVIVPKTKILCAADVIELYFTRGVYAVFPITYVKDFSRGSTMAVPVGP